MWAESDGPGHGSIFHVTMKTRAAAADAVPRGAARRPGSLDLDPEQASRHPLRILLAEDNVVNQKLALRLLSQMGYQADVAANGVEAVEAVERQPYDLVLMDVQMPEMDGLEATRVIIDKVPLERRPWIVAMTANAMDGDREACLEVGHEGLYLEADPRRRARRRRAHRTTHRRGRGGDLMPRITSSRERGVGRSKESNTDARGWANVLAMCRSSRS